MSGQKSIRAFIAVHLPDIAKIELGNVTGVLAEQTPKGSVRWVRPELMHLTLRFLGDTAVSDLPPLITHLDRLAAQHTPFTLHLGSLGWFPNRSRPRVIWVGLTGDVAAVQKLQADVETAVVALGWPSENKSFQAHLTIGRVKDSRQMQQTTWKAAVQKLAVPITAIHLIESQLHPSGPVYTIQHTSQFREP